jgi:hypothetical protein
VSDRTESLQLVVSQILPGQALLVRKQGPGPQQPENDAGRTADQIDLRDR